MRALPLSLLTLLVAACSSDEPPRPGGPGASGSAARIERVALSSVGGEDVERGARIVARLTPPEGIAPWIVEGGRAEWGPNPRPQLDDGSDVLAVHDSAGTRVRIPGPFDFGDSGAEGGAFNRVRVALTTMARRQPVAVELHRGGRAVARSPETWVHGAAAVLDAVADLPDVPRGEGPFDELVLVFGESLFFTVNSVELIQQDLLDWLPHPDEDPELVFVGHDGRQAVGISAAHPLRGELDGARNARLTFSAGLPEGFRTPVLLRVRLAAGNRVVERTFPLEPWSNAWTYAAIPLDELAGERVELTFATEAGAGATEAGAAPESTSGSGSASPPGSEALAMVGEVMVVHPGASSAPPPTVLLVTSDTHRADHVGASGSGVAVETPFLDSLAARGVLFERGWSTCNVTIPSHVAIMTGVNPRDTHVIDNRTSLGGGATTLAERFRESGFATLALVSTSHLADEISGLGQGFDRMSIPPSATRVAAETTADLRTWLDEEQGKPLFVWLHLFDAHGPYTPPRPFRERSLERMRAAGETGPSYEDLAAYRGEVDYLDEQLAELFTHERLAGAIVAVTADHGESLGAHDILFNHSGMYPDTLHVPLILAWPGSPAGVRVGRPTRQIDLGRTLLDLAGLGDAGFPGDDLVADLDAEPARDEPLFSIAGNGTSAAVRLGDRYFVLHLYEHLLGSEGKRHRHARHSVELFDLTTDPDCERDLATEEPETTRKLRAMLVGWLAKERRTGWATAANLDAEQQAELEALGYFGASSAHLEGTWIDPTCDCAECAKY